MTLIQQLAQSWLVYDADRGVSTSLDSTYTFASLEAAADFVEDLNRMQPPEDGNPYRAVPMVKFVRSRGVDVGSANTLFKFLLDNPSRNDSMSDRVWRMNYSRTERVKECFVQWYFRQHGTTLQAVTNQQTRGRRVESWRHVERRNRLQAESFREALTAVRQYENGEIRYIDVQSQLDEFWADVGSNERILERFVEVAEEHVGSGVIPFSRRDCGHWEHDDDATTVADGDVVCESCLSDNYREVDGEYHHESVCYYWESDGEYHLEPEEDDDDDRDHDLLRSWGSSCGHLDHDRSFTQNQWGDFTMGVELEVQATDSRNDALEDCDYELNRHNAKKIDNYCMFKRDGSLSESRGFEIVTAARRLADHIAVFKQWKPSGIEAWSAGNCGMHVHIDSRAFSSLTLGKFLMLINDQQNVEFIRAIAGRHPLRDSQAESYAAALSQTVNPHKVKKGASVSRYRMVNLCNLTRSEAERLGTEYNRDSKGTYSTVEVRVFRASLKKERLLAQLEFTHAAVMYCRVASWHDLDGAHFKLWLARTPGYPHLAKWFGVPVCRTNEPKARAQQCETVSAE